MGEFQRPALSLGPRRHRAAARPQAHSRARLPARLARRARGPGALLRRNRPHGRRVPVGARHPGAPRLGREHAGPVHGRQRLRVPARQGLALRSRAQRALPGALAGPHSSGSGHRSAALGRGRRSYVPGSRGTAGTQDHVRAEFSAPAARPSRTGPRTHLRGPTDARFPSLQRGDHHPHLRPLAHGALQPLQADLQLHAAHAVLAGGQLHRAELARNHGRTPVGSPGPELRPHLLRPPSGAGVVRCRRRSGGTAQPGRAPAVGLRPTQADRERSRRK